MAVALAIVWTKDAKPSETEGWILFYFVQLFFNAAWTMFFFGLHSTLLAFIDLLFLGFTVLCLIARGSEIDRRVPYLLAPYLAWIFFAAYLSIGIWYLN